MKTTILVWGIAFVTMGLLAGCGDDFELENNAIEIPTLTNIAGFDLGGVHACAILSDGSLRCWGHNQEGQLGLGDNIQKTYPDKVYGLTEGVTAVSAGNNHTCAIVNGGAKCWGYNATGQLGNDSTTSSSIPVDVTGLTSGVTDISAGKYHTCAVHNGAVKCWGLNTSGQLGNSTTAAAPDLPTTTPVGVTLIGGVTAVAVAVGSRHSCAIDVNNAVSCWGKNDEGQLGNNDPTLANSNTPVATSIAAGATALGAGEEHSCAIVAAGAIQCWGMDEKGQLGNATVENKSLTPVSVDSATAGSTDLAVSKRHSCAVVNTGVRCWGDNSFDQLGSTVASTGTPTAVGAGNQFSCVLVSTELFCWGRNSYGQLGNGSTDTPSSNSSVKVVDVY